MTVSENLPNWFEYVKPNFSLLPSDSSLLILQIGVYKGDCTEHILQNYKVKQIIDVDTWEGSMEHPELNLSFNKVEEIYDKKFSSNNLVKKMKMTSDLFFANNFMAERFDFIYIDGAHTSTQVLVDGINGFASLKVGGILAFDDYEWPMYSGTLNNPKIGIDSWLKLFHGHFEVMVQNYQIWVKKNSDI
jgi:predicted O-methyltransferase YrrM